MGKGDEKMKRIKTLSVCFALLFVCVMFAACRERTQTGTGNGTGNGTFTYEQVMAKFEGEIEQNATIRVLDNQMAVETGHLSEVLAAFNERYKEYNVQAVDANMDQYVDLEQNGPDGYGPDVLYQANDMLMRYAEGGHILPLPTEQLDTEQLPDTVMDVYKLETYGMDLYYGMPVAQQSTVLTYRKDLLPENWEEEWDDNENGVPDMVETMNGLYAYSKQVREESDGSKYGLYMSLTDQYFNSGYLLSYGAYIFGETHDDIGLNADGAETGLNLFRDLAGVLGSNCIPQAATTQVATYLTNAAGTVFCTIGTPDWLTTFQENLAATYERGGMSKEAATAAAKKNLVVTAPPRLPADGDIKKEITDVEAQTFEPTTMGGVNAFSISAYTQYPKACLAFVKFVSEYENLKWRSEALGAVPARTDLAAEFGGVSEILSTRVSQGKVYMMPSTRDTQYIWDPLSSLFNDVATDNTTRTSPVYTTPQALKGALDKLVSDIRSAMAIGNIS